MRFKIAAALAALPFATTANAANVYSACIFDNETGARSVTQLFTLKGDALRDSYGEWTYEKNKVWEEQFAQEPYETRAISGYYDYNFVGQFGKYVEKQGWSHPDCWVTTSKDHAFAWFAKYAQRYDIGRAQDWRPDAKAGVVGVSDWSGRVSSVVEAEPEPEADAPSPRKSEEAASSDAPRRPKMTNAEADAKYEADMAEYNKKLAEQQKQVADFKRAEDEVARKKQEQKLAAERAAADYQRQLEAHAQTVRNQQLEYEKEVARPAGVPNAVYRGFWARDCDAARRSATLGAGTSSTTRFKEVTFVTDASGCTVQGWWWNVAGGGTATRQ
ncbi:MAG: hypothetical protein HOP96_11205 [Sphingomonas sp.]|nr:hypothetical protein [Sphingomonas sp.]